ncbi:MAG: hypothetical protein ACRCUY_10110 [Thermoguttaceae bacterium]
MSRMIVCFLFITVTFLSGLPLLVAASPTEIAQSGKSIYSSRSGGGRPMYMPPLYAPPQMNSQGINAQGRTFEVVTEEVVIEPRTAPERPAIPMTTESGEMIQVLSPNGKKPTGFPAPQIPRLQNTQGTNGKPLLFDENEMIIEWPAEDELPTIPTPELPQNAETKPETVKKSGKSAEEIEALLESIKDKPTSGIDFPDRVIAPKKQLSTEKSSSADNPIWHVGPESKSSSTTTRSETRDAVVAMSEIDNWYARLAKIQLERHNLAETLNLIGKMKSNSAKAQTLVDFAEYVSRDINYRKESDALFGLAVSGIAAINDNKPVSLSLAIVSPTPVIQPKIEQPKIEQPKTEQPKTEPPKTGPKPILFDETKNSDVKNSEVKNNDLKNGDVKNEETTKPITSPRRPPIAISPSISNEAPSEKTPEKTNTENEKATSEKLDTSKSVEQTPPKASSPPKARGLDDLMTEEDENEMTETPSPSKETPAVSTPSKRPRIIVPIEADEEVDSSPKTEQEPKTESSPKTETKTKASPPPAMSIPDDAPKTIRKPILK